jgi:hypothetical protein
MLLIFLFHLFNEVNTMEETILERNTGSARWRITKTAAIWMGAEE